MFIWYTRLGLIKNNNLILRFNEKNRILSIYKRGLDVHPQTRHRFKNQNDHESVELLDILYKDEITHVAAGIKWFQYACKKYDLVILNNLEWHDDFYHI